MTQADPTKPAENAPRIESVSAITLVTADMKRSVAFYDALGFERQTGGQFAAFTTFAVGGQYLNISAEIDQRRPSKPHNWGRAIFYVSNVDAFYQQAIERRLSPAFPPMDAAGVRGISTFVIRTPMN